MWQPQPEKPPTPGTSGVQLSTCSVCCQFLFVLLQPEREGCYTLADVKRTRPQSSLLFNTMFNLHKFMAFENRDPFALRAEQLGEEGQVCVSVRLHMFASASALSDSSCLKCCVFAIRFV